MQIPPPEPLTQWAVDPDAARLAFHGSGVAIDGQGILILGPSGSGKSSLALALLAHGASLISDDAIWLETAQLIRPDSAPPFIEARGIGLLNAGPFAATAPLSFVVDLSRTEPHRLPPRRIATAQGQNMPLILGAGQMTLAPAILHLVLHGKIDPDP
jgi:HPr kinase/phosphorylase